MLVSSLVALKKIKILHLSTSYYPAFNYGGPIFSVHQLNESLSNNCQVDITVFTTNSTGLGRSNKHKEQIKEFNENYRVRYFNKTSSNQFSLGLIFAVFKSKEFDIIHITGVYSYLTVFGMLSARIFNIPVVWSPRGSLQEWGGYKKKPAKKIVNYLLNMILKKNSTVLHVTSKDEANESIKKFPVRYRVIKNGVSEIGKINVSKWRNISKYKFFSLGRIDPKKGIDILLHSVAMLKNINWELVVCGGGEPAYLEELAGIVENLHLKNKVKFIGHVTGPEKTKLINAAHIAIFPSHTENFGMAISEVLGFGVPVIVSKNTPWKSVEKYHCGLWVENKPEIIRDSIYKIIDNDLHDMSKNALNYISLNFSWDILAQDMYELYLELSLK